MRSQKYTSRPAGAQGLRSDMTTDRTVVKSAKPDRNRNQVKSAKPAPVARTKK